MGDWIGWLASSHLLWSAWKLGASANTLLRMTGHLVIDAVVGAIPILGDLFDVGWKANNRNLAILERQAAAPDRTQRESRWIVGALLGGIGMVLVGAAWMGWLVLSAVVALLNAMAGAGA